MNNRVSCYTLATIFIVSSSSVSAESVSAVLEAAVARSPAKALTGKPDAKCDKPDAALAKTTGLARSCLISLAAIDKLSSQKDFSLVDVRSPADYDRYHITGSINIPLHQIKTKEFLKRLSVVMVNDGRSTNELEKSCAELKQVGFSRVSVLEGGLFSWRANKRSLEGDPVAQAKLNRMTAAELIEERNKSNLYVIDVTASGKHKDLSNWLPEKIIAAPIKLKGRSIKSIGALITQQRKNNPKARLLLIADDNVVYERIDAELLKSGISSGILRLDGGMKGYREYVTRQLAMWSEQNKPRRYEACRG